MRPVLPVVQERSTAQAVRPWSEWTTRTAAETPSTSETSTRMPASAGMPSAVAQLRAPIGVAIGPSEGDSGLRSAIGSRVPSSSSRAVTSSRSEVWSTPDMTTTTSPDPAWGATRADSALDPAAESAATPASEDPPAVPKEAITSPGTDLTRNPPRPSTATTAAATPRCLSPSRRRSGTTCAPASGSSLRPEGPAAGSWSRLHSWSMPSPRCASTVRAALIRATRSSGIGPGSGRFARSARIPVGSCSTGAVSSWGWLTGFSGTCPRGVLAGSGGAGRRGRATGGTSWGPLRFRRAGNGRRVGSAPAVAARVVAAATQHLGERLPTAEASRLHGALRHTEHLRRLGDRQAVHVDQDQGHPLPLGQPGEGLAHVEAGLDRGVVVVQVGQVELTEVAGAAHGHLLAAQPVQAGVDDDAVQPGRDGGLAAEGVGTPEGGDERVLHGIRGQLAVGGGAQRHRVHPVAVPAEQLAEGGAAVAVDVALEQLAVGEGAEVVEHHGLRRQPVTTTSSSQARRLPLSSALSLVNHTTMYCPLTSAGTSKVTVPSASALSPTFVAPSSRLSGPT